MWEPDREINEINGSREELVGIDSPASSEDEIDPEVLFRRTQIQNEILMKLKETLL